MTQDANEFPRVIFETEFPGSNFDRYRAVQTDATTALFEKAGIDLMGKENWQPCEVYNRDRLICNLAVCYAGLHDEHDALRTTTIGDRKGEDRDR